MSGSGSVSVKNTLAELTAAEERRKKAARANVSELQKPFLNNESLDLSIGNYSGMNLEEESGFGSSKFNRVNKKTELNESEKEFIKNLYTKYNNKKSISNLPTYLVMINNLLDTGNLPDAVKTKLRLMQAKLSN